MSNDFFYNIEEIKSEWSLFLKIFPESSSNSISYDNKIFDRELKSWCKKISKKYKVSFDELKDYFTI